MVTYLITFTCYGQHLHGDPAGSVDKMHRVRHTPHLAFDPAREDYERHIMRCAPYSLDQRRREEVIDAIQQGCKHRGWRLIAAHVRSTHVHIVVEAVDRPEMVMNACKSYASKRLNDLGLDPGGQKRWTRHGSTRWLNGASSITAAISYVLDEQGVPMSVYRGT